MKKSSKILLIIIIAIIFSIAVGFAYYKFSDNDSNEMNELNEKNNVTNKNEEANLTKTSPNTFTFKNEFGDGTKTKTIEADQCIRGTGYAGASSNVYYTKDGNLYHLELANLETETLATGVESIGSSENGIIAVKAKNCKIVKENSYITYQSDEADEKPISVEEATKIVEDKYGTVDTETGNKMSYSYMNIVKDNNNNKYYAFRHSWIVDNSHASFLQNVFVSFDGKSVKTTSKPQEFEKEEVVEFDD